MISIFLELFKGALLFVADCSFELELDFDLSALVAVGLLPLLAARRVAWPLVGAVLGVSGVG
jgi:hypothetical protein